jgi:hypothetical protein
MSPLPADQGERMKLKQEALYDILAAFFSGGTYNNVFLGLFSELNENLKKNHESLNVLNGHTAKANESFVSLNENLHKTHQCLEELNSHIVKANESSDKLSTALNKITLWGTIIAASSLFVAIAAVALEYYKTIFIY